MTKNSDIRCQRTSLRYLWNEEIEQYWESLQTSGGAS